MTSLNLPKGKNTVRLQAIDTTAQLLCESECLIEPVLEGHEFLNLPNVAWFIENKNTGQKIMFDAGVRRDFWNLAPMATKAIRASTPGLRVDRDVPDILVEAGKKLEELDWIIWSHHHWDHIGVVSRFPKNVGVVVGQGFGAAHLPGYPANPKSSLLEEDFEGRPYNEITFDLAGLKIGGFLAYDFWGDGSFYLLNTPGHTVGHMSALARTTEDDFVFLGGDICHFVGTFRPSSGIPMPNPLPSTARFDSCFRCPCSAATFLAIHPEGPEANDKPFFKPAGGPKSFYIDPPLAHRTVQELAIFDSSPHVLVCISHDPGISGVLPMINQDADSEIGDWRAKGYKEVCHWDFLNELPRDGRPGRPKGVDGIVGEGKKILEKE